jgi:hypothetical protein
MWPKWLAFAIFASALLGQGRFIFAELRVGFGLAKFDWIRYEIKFKRDKIFVELRLEEKNLKFCVSFFVCNFEREKFGIYRVGQNKVENFQRIVDDFHDAWMLALKPAESTLNRRLSVNLLKQILLPQQKCWKKINKKLERKNSSGKESIIF